MGDSHAWIRATVALIILILYAGCGPSSKQRAVRATFASVDATAAAFVVWDGNHQREIVERATSLEEGEAALAAYRARRTKLVSAFERAYRAIAIAAMESTDAHVTAARDAAALVYRLLDELADERGPP